MITATFIADSEMYELYLKVHGHAGQAEIGQDIICASASILAHTYASLVYSLRREMDCEPIIDLTGGNTNVSCRCKEAITYKEILYALRYTRTGYELLARDYPRFVEVNVVGEDF